MTTIVPSGQLLIYWISSRQLPGDAILIHLTWQEAVRLASTCKSLWQEVERMVTLAWPDREAAFKEKTPDRLRIPLLTGITAEDARAQDNRALRWACLNGDLAMAQWLTDRFKLTAEDVRVYDNIALQMACYSGHLAVAQWLTERFQLTAVDARANNNWALRWTCRYGDLAMAQWLTERFQLTAVDARANNNWVVQRAK